MAFQVFFMFLIYYLLCIVCTTATMGDCLRNGKNSFQAPAVLPPTTRPPDSRRWFNEHKQACRIPPRHGPMPVSTAVGNDGRCGRLMEADARNVGTGHQSFCW